MSATIITFGISKGGSSKTTSAGAVAYLLAKEYKVLAIDFDAQGNLTSLLTGVMDICTEFADKTILEGIKANDLHPFIIPVIDKLHLVPSNDYLSKFPQYLYQEHQGQKAMALKGAIDSVIEEYDYIIIDTPPALSENTVNAVSASDYAVIMFDGSQFCYYAIEKFLEICEAARANTDSKIQPLGILFSIVDTRTLDTQMMIDVIDEEYKGLRFDTIIKRKAATKRLPIYGFKKNPELNAALEGYIPLVKEVINRAK